jgi:hypothetical protein
MDKRPTQLRDLNLLIWLIWERANPEGAPRADRIIGMIFFLLIMVFLVAISAMGLRSWIIRKFTSLARSKMIPPS